MSDNRPSDTEIDGLWRLHRPYLVDLAFRMLGNIYDAEDVVQVAFTRLFNVDLAEIDEIRAWLNVVVSRLCLDQLRSARHRHEATVGSVDERRLPSSSPTADPADPADQVTLDDSLRLALLVVLEQLSPSERAVFVLHDVFQFPFDEVATIVGRTASASRQIASRARRRIQAEAGPGRFQAGLEEQHEIAQGFIAACGGGDMEGLMKLLDPDVVGVVDLGGSHPAPKPLHGQKVVSRAALGFFGPASGVTLVSLPVYGHPAVLAYRERQLAAIIVFKVKGKLIYDIHSTADPARFGLVTQ